MRDLAIIIPSRLAAVRFPNKPLMKINNKEMILHVHQTAIKSDVGEVYVVSPDEEILKLIKQNGGNAIKSLKSHETGTDRVFEVFKKVLNSEPRIIVNLHGDWILFVLLLEELEPSLDHCAVLEWYSFELECLRIEHLVYGLLSPKFRAIKNLPKNLPNRSKIDPKSLQNRTLARASIFHDF